MSVCNQSPRWTLWTGAILWLLGLTLIVGSAQTVRARAARATVPFRIHASDAALRIGDRVFVELDRGLEFVGEVAGVDAEGATIAVRTQALSHINISSEAVCWRTPLTAEEALDALLPRRIQQLAAERIAADWRRIQAEVSDEWHPIVQDLSQAFLEAIGEDVRDAFLRHEDELMTIAAAHGEAWADAWPLMQRRLQPILQEHLNPVLSRLLNEAVSDAPKFQIGLLIARGKHAEAYRKMLDWLTEYLAHMPEKDRAEVRVALEKTWHEASTDEVLTAETRRLGHELLNDPRLHDVLREIYRESVTTNPHAAEFIRSQVVESPQVRRRFFELLDLLAPTLRDVAALSLFDEQGATRPEVVHILRSVALQRDMAWITLRTPLESAAPLTAGSVIPGHCGSVP